MRAPKKTEAILHCHPETLCAAVASLTSNGNETTFSAVAKALKLDVSAGQRRVRTAIGKGFVRNLEDRRGRPARLVLGDPLPEDRQLLPSPEGLQVCSASAGGVNTPLPPEHEPSPNGATSPGRGFRPW